MYLPGSGVWQSRIKSPSQLCPHQLSWKQLLRPEQGAQHVWEGGQALFADGWERQPRQANSNLPTVTITCHVLTFSKLLCPPLSHWALRRILWASEAGMMIRKEAMKTWDNKESVCVEIVFFFCLKRNMYKDIHYSIVWNGNRLKIVVCINKKIWTHYSISFIWTVT